MKATTTATDGSCVPAKIPTIMGNFKKIAHRHVESPDANHSEPQVPDELQISSSIFSVIISTAAKPKVAEQAFLGPKLI